MAAVMSEFHKTKTIFFKFFSCKILCLDDFHTTRYENFRMACKLREKRQMQCLQPLMVYWPLEVFLTSNKDGRQKESSVHMYSSS